MATNPFPSMGGSEHTALVAQSEILPAMRLPERTYLEGLVEEPSGKSFMGMIENVRRDFRARKATTTHLDRVRDQLLSYSQARLEVELQGELARMVEGLRHAMTMVQLEHYAIEQEFAVARTMGLRVGAAREFKEFGRRLVEIGYPEEQVERALANTVGHMLSVAGAEIATMEGLDGFARAARPESVGSERLGQGDAILHAEPR